MCLCVHVCMHACMHVGMLLLLLPSVLLYTSINKNIYIYIYNPPWINKPLLLIKSRGPRQLINSKQNTRQPKF